MIMELIIISVIIVAIAIIGFYTIHKECRSYEKELEFANRYRNRFVSLANEYISSRNVNNEEYTWLTMNVHRIQTDMGVFGILDYRAPFGMYVVKNYQIVVNTLPKFRNGEIKDFDIQSTDESILRYIGYNEAVLLDIEAEKKSPLKWLSTGVGQLISLPMAILKEFGVISVSSYNTWKSSRIKNILAGLISLLGIVSIVMTVVLGWEEFINLFIN